MRGVTRGALAAASLAVGSARSEDAPNPGCPFQ